MCSSYRCGPDHPNYDNKTHVVIGSEYLQTELIKAIEKADFFVAHNTKFEYGWLERCGLDIANTLAFCTQIGEYVLRSNRLGLLNLDACCKRHNIKSKNLLGSLLLKNEVCPSEWPRKWLVPYSAQDVVIGEKLFLKQRKKLIDRDCLKTAFTRNIFTPVLLDIEKKGMHIDEVRVRPLQNQYYKRLQELTIELDKITDGANPNSAPQMREVLYEKLKFPKPTDKKWLGKNGDPTTKFDYITTLKPKNNKQKRFVQLKQEYSKVNAALTKCLNKFVDCVNETKDHVLTATLNQTITATQRLSSSGKNYKAQFQNFPRIFKPLFSARKEGWLIGEIDQAQLEYRVAVWFGQDEAGLYDILHKVDSHSFTAEKIYGTLFTKADDTERKSYRTRAKAHTFKPLYGGQSGTPAEQRYYKAFKKKHRGVTKAQEEWKRKALATGKVTIPSGLTFYYPDTKITPSGYITNSTIICNYPVQSLATADIVPVGVVYQWHLMRLARLRSFLINTIHDSSVGEVHPEEKEIYSQIGTYAFVDIVYEYLKRVYEIDFNVPLEAECEYNKNWSDSVEWRETYL